MTEPNKTNILLESGTNEIEIMEFTIDGNLYGINVAKVREIMMSAPVKPMPHAHASVEGIFKPRDTVLTVIDLPFYLKGLKTERDPKDIFVVTNFNKLYIAFRVHTVVGISRISWRDIQKPDKAVSGGQESVATGIAQCNNELVTILDFERIVADIAPETSIQKAQVVRSSEHANDSPIFIAEDSSLLARMIRESLNGAGYSNLEMFPDGQELWNRLEALPADEPVSDHVALVITDIEMPQMDGHRLTKLIKSSTRFQNIPLVIFSSLISEEMRVKGQHLGADEQLSKPEIGRLVKVLDKMLGH
ncbi:MAG: chemotaxis protein [Eubacteriales bacterium]